MQMGALIDLESAMEFHSALDIFIALPDNMIE